jgi:hypothetical protein
MSISAKQYEYFGKVFELIDRRFAIHRLTRKCLAGQAPKRGERHPNEENATVIRDLHRGGAECRAGGSETPSVPET